MERKSPSAAPIRQASEEEQRQQAVLEALQREWDERLSGLDLKKVLSKGAWRGGPIKVGPSS